MAETKCSGNQKSSMTTRRGFFGAVGVVTAAAALPRVAGAAPRGGRDVRSHLAAMRAAYLTQVDGIAEELRPRFQAGELHAFTETDFGPDAAMYEIERACAAALGLEVTRTPAADGEWFDGDEPAAHLVLAASRFGPAVTEGGGSTSYHPCYDAATAAAWDVIMLARERGWYVPAANECALPDA